MAGRAKAASSDAPRSLVGRLVAWISLVLMAFVAGLVITIMVEWVGLTLVWFDEGAGRSARVLAQDIAWLSANRSTSMFGLPTSAEAVVVLYGTLYEWMIVWTGVEQGMQWLSGLPGLGVGREYLVATHNAIQTFFVRVAICITAMPLFLLFAYWGVMEGMVRRDLRRFGGDIEHGMVYHWAKHIAGAVIFIPVIVYLAWPGSINPAWLFIPFAFALGVNMVVVTANFTKYI